MTFDLELSGRRALVTGGTKGVGEENGLAITMQSGATPGLVAAKSIGPPPSEWLRKHRRSEFGNVSANTAQAASEQVTGASTRRSDHGEKRIANRCKRRPLQMPAAIRSG